MEVTEMAKKIAELGRQKAEAEKKLNRATWDFKTNNKYLDAAIKDGRETWIQRRNVEIAAKDMERAAKEIEQIDNELRRLKV